MNYFSKNKVLHFSLFFLIMLNAGTLIVVFSHSRPGSPPHLRESEAGADDSFLRQELQFDDRQIQEFQHLERQFLRRNEEIRREIGDTKRDMYATLLPEPPGDIDIETSLQRIAHLHRQMEQETFDFFENVKRLIRPEQEELFYHFIGRILIKIDPGHRPPPHDRQKRPRP